MGLKINNNSRVIHICIPKLNGNNGIDMLKQQGFVVGHRKSAPICLQDEREGDNMLESNVYNELCQHEVTTLTSVRPMLFLK